MQHQNERLPRLGAALPQRHGNTRRDKRRLASAKDHRPGWRLHALCARNDIPRLGPRVRVHRRLVTVGHDGRDALHVSGDVGGGGAQQERTDHGHALAAPGFPVGRRDAEQPCLAEGRDDGETRNACAPGLQRGGRGAGNLVADPALVDNVASGVAPVYRCQ